MEEEDIIILASDLQSKLEDLVTFDDDGEPMLAEDFHEQLGLVLFVLLKSHLLTTTVQEMLGD